MSRHIHAPYAPLDIPKPVAPEVWIVDGPEISFSLGGLKLPFPTRATLVRLADGGLWIHSPTQVSEPLLAAVRALGPVRFLIAPNSIHYWWIADWKAAFPEAQVFAAPGLARTAKRPTPIDCELGEAPPAAWGEAFDQVLVQGDALNEADFFHRASRTLILTDLIENFERGRVRGWFARQLMRLGGVLDPDGKTPLDMQLGFLRQRAAVRAAVRRMIDWAPERVILAHGRWYETDAVDELKRAFRWVL
jgi:hypothetical protein